MGPLYLNANATQLGLKAAAVANRLGVGIEIDYEQNRNPNLTGLQHSLLLIVLNCLMMQQEIIMQHG